jgi:hypothetical protein
MKEYRGDKMAKIYLSHNRSHAIGHQANIILDFFKQPHKPVIVVAWLSC